MWSLVVVVARRCGVGLPLAGMLLLTMLPALGQPVSEPDPRDNPNYRTKVGGGCDDGLIDSLESVTSEAVNDVCDPTRTCCRDWIDSTSGEPGAGSAKACDAHGSEAPCEQSLGCNWVKPPGSFFGDSLPGSCKPDLTQMCCACDNVSPDGNCAWTSVCFKCAGTVAENGCPEACAFDILKWRTGIDALDEPMLAIPSGCSAAGDVASHLGCTEVPRFQIAIAVVFIYAILGCSVAPWLFLPCKICKCCCKCIPGVESLCDEAYSSPDSASSDDEETRRERRRRRKKQEIRMKKKRKKTTTTNTAGRGDRYKVVERAMLKRECELDSDVVGSLAEGTVIRSKEIRAIAGGQLRVRCSKGWASVVARDGSVLLETLDHQDLGDAAAAAGAAVDQMRSAADGSTPGDAAPASSAAAGTAVDQIRSAADGSIQNGSQQGQASAQDDWIERFSAEHNRKYWINTTTRQSSWTDPKQQAQPQRTPDRAETGAAPSARQPAWKKVFSEQHNRHYWINPSTGQSTWTDPTTTLVQNPTRASRSATSFEREV